ncbi:OmpA family protein [Psychrobacter faecalis]|uniref:OmpA family protein n=1 Tax=Psychrobacter faecalis TaxID=180588 RepID=UPI0028ADE90C|nr:OmpA family protein [Psychrobacter faecalis]
MTSKAYLAISIFSSVFTLSACQAALQSVTANQQASIVARVVPAILDSDGDGVLDDIDECPETPPNVVVDVKGCPVEVDVGGLEMEFNGFFPPMSSQLPDIYDAVFVKLAESLNDYPRANIFIFGHAATNEMDKDTSATFGFDSLSRNRALSIKNTLVLQHGIDAKRIRTYDCSNKILVTDTAFIDPSFEKFNVKNMEAKQRRATLKASSSVKNLSNLEYDSYIQMYGEYAKHCELFE